MELPFSVRYACFVIGLTLLVAQMAFHLFAHYSQRFYVWEALVLVALRLALVTLLLLGVGLLYARLFGGVGWPRSLVEWGRYALLTVGTAAMAWGLAWLFEWGLARVSRHL